MVAVGTRIAPRPPHRSRRALLTHRAYMRTRLSRGYSGLAILKLLVTDLGARSSPAAAKRCAEGAGLEGAPKSVTSSKRSQILSYSRTPAFRFARFVPIQGE